MCKNAVGTAVAALQAIEPTIKNLLSVSGMANDPVAVAALNAYNAALTTLQNWQSGTASQDVIEVLNALSAAVTALGALPGLSTYAEFISIILAGVETVIGIVDANSPAASTETPAPAEAQAMHVAHVVAETQQKVAVLVPGFKRSKWHSVQSQYNKLWNDTADTAGKPELKVA